MSSRNVILAAIVFAGLAAGTTLLANESYSSLKSVIQAAQHREATVHPRQGTKPSREDLVSSRIDSLTTLLASNRELIVYGSIASFGILMMGLAISNVSSNSKTKQPNSSNCLSRKKRRQK